MYIAQIRAEHHGLSNDQCPNRKAFSLDLNVSNDMEYGRHNMPLPQSSGDTSSGLWIWKLFHEISSIVYYQWCNKN